MDWLAPSVIATMAGTALLSFIYGYLYVHDRRKYLAVWALSWSIYFTRYIFMLFLINGYGHPLFLIANQVASLLSGIVLLWGTHLFIEKKFPVVWIYGGTGGVLWIIISILLKFPFFVISTPTFAFLAVVYIWTGVEFIKTRAIEGHPKKFTGWAFVAWGIHKADYPFVRPVLWLAPWGYLTAAFIEFCVAFGMLLTYFHNIRSELKKQQFLLRKAQEIGKIGTWAMDFIENRLLWTDETYDIFGVPLGTELTYETFLDCVHPDDREYVDGQWKASFNNLPYDVEHRVVANGKIKWVREKGELEFDGRGECIKAIGFTQDITDRKVAQKALQESERKFRSISENSLVGVYIIQNDVFIYVNPKFAEIFGYSVEECLDNVHFLDFVHPEDFEEVQQQVQKRVSEELEYVNYTFRGIKKSGEIIHVEIYGSSILINGRVAATGTILDITDRIQLESQLRQSQKLESIGTLAGGIAHEFNNVLGIILGNTELALEDVPDRNPAKEHLREILTASFRAKEVVGRILSFARKTMTALKPLEINAVVRESLKLIRASIPAMIDIRSQIPDNPKMILGNSTEIHQILINLCTNAADAMKETGGVLEVAISEVGPAEAEVPHEDPHPSVFVKLTVKDSGEGIAPEVLEKVFEPYFTTKPFGQGTGMGLAVVYGLVKKCKGDIHIESAVGEGTTVEIVFPKIAEKASPMAKKDQLPHGNERILLIDDDSSIVKMVSQMLERLGYRVVGMTESTTALEHFRSNPDAFDLVVTDMAMPHLSGDQLSVELIKVRKDIPILLCTGHSDTIDEDRAKEMGIKGFAMKPLDKEKLARAIAKILNRQP